MTYLCNIAVAVTRIKSTLRNTRAIAHDCKLDLCIFCRKCEGDCQCKNSTVPGCCYAVAKVFRVVARVLCVVAFWKSQKTSLWYSRASMAQITLKTLVFFDRFASTRLVLRDAQYEQKLGFFTGKCYRVTSNNRKLLASTAKDSSTFGLFAVKQRLTWPLNLKSSVHWGFRLDTFGVVWRECGTWEAFQIKMYAYTAHAVLRS